MLPKEAGDDLDGMAAVMNASPIDILVVGGAAIDYAAQGRDLPTPGENIGSHSFYKGPGGKGANAAVTVARLGAHTALIARLGSDQEGELLLQHLQQEGVNLQLVSQDLDAPTGATVIHVDQQGRKQTLARGGSNHKLAPEHVRVAFESILSHGKPKAVLVQLEVPLACVEEAVYLACRHNIRVILDPAPAQALPGELLRQLDVVTPNTTEAKVLTGIDVHDRNSACRAARSLLERGVGAAAVDAGTAGKVLVWPDGWEWLARFPVQTVDTTGAGDAFAAALVVRLAEGAFLVEAARFANAAAALATTGLGTQAALPNRQQIVGLLER